MIRRLLAACLAIGLVLVGPSAAAWAATEEAVLAGGCFWCLEHDLEDPVSYTHLTLPTICSV